jgi:hypothetical protein
MGILGKCFIRFPNPHGFSHHQSIRCPKPQPTPASLPAGAAIQLDPATARCGSTQFQVGPPFRDPRQDAGGGFFWVKALAASEDEVGHAGIFYYKYLV